MSLSASHLRYGVIALVAMTLGVGVLFGWMVLDRKREDALRQAEEQADFALATAVAAGMHKEAAARLLPRVEKGEAKAQYQLGTLLMEGGGELQASPAQARALFEKAYAQNYTPAATNLGVMYQHGIGGAKDYKRAAELLEVEASKGDPISQNNLGALYATGGYGLDRDPAKAMDWYGKAAAQDNPLAQNSLCSLKAQTGKTEDFAQALDWCGKAAEAGWVPAQSNLALLLSTAPGFRRDMIEAWKWAAIAAHNKSNNGRALLTQLTSKLSEEQLAEARRRFDRHDKPVLAPPMASNLR